MNFDVQIVTPTELMEWVKAKKKFHLVDIRNEMEKKSMETPILFSKAKSIPNEKLLKNIDLVSSSERVIICCAHGERSFFTTYILSINYSVDNIFSLQSGIDGWIKQFGT